MKPLQNWLESFTWNPSLPLHWLAGIAGLAVVLFIVTAWRERRAAKRPLLLPLLWLLRAAAIAAIALALAGPSHRKTKRETTRQGVTIVVDASGSMSLSDPDALVPEWTTALPRDDARGILTAARHHLRRLESMPPAQWRSPVAFQCLRDAANALRAAPLPSPAPLLEQAVPKLENAAAALEDGKSLIVQDLLRDVSAVRAETERILTSLRVVPPAATAVNPGAEGPSRARLERIGAWLDAAESTWMRDLRKEFDISVTAMGAVTVPAEENVRKSWIGRAPADGPQETNLAAALDEAARDAGLGRARAVVLITDGCHNAPAPVEEAAARLRGLPLICVPSGATASPARQDLALLYAVAPGTAFLHDTIRIEAALAGAGCEGAETEVILRDGEREIGRKKIRIKEGAADPKIEFEWKPDRVGQHKFRIEALPLNQEVSKTNNSQEAGVEVLEDTMRILLADSEPRWETRYLLNLFKRDQRIEFQTLLFAPAHTAAEGKTPSPPAFPYKLDDLAKNRIVLLGDLSSQHLTREHQTMLVEYVTKRGGTLILMAGGESMPAAYAGQPLGSIIPVTEQALAQGSEFRVTLTPEARGLDGMKLGDSVPHTEEIWTNATTKVPLIEMSSWSVAKPQARVLLAATPLTGDAAATRAFLTYQDAGRGRVVYLSSPETWHLRYLEGDHWHYRFWGQLLHWAVARDLAGGSRTVHLALDRQRAPQDSPVHVRLRLEDLTGRAVTGASSRAVVRSASGTEKSAPLTEDPQSPGNYTGMLTGLPTGACRVAVEGHEIDRLLVEEGRQGKIDTSLFIDPPENRESRDILCDAAQISRIAAAGGGWVLPPGAVPNALRQLGLRASVTEETSLTPLWNEWPWLWLVLGLLTAEWILRKPAGVL